jgi:hypothetical protein
MVGVIEAPTVEKGAPAVTKTAPLRRVKRLERPNLAEHEENIGKLHAEMDGLHARVREIKTILDNKQQSRGVQSPEMIEANGVLNALKANFKEVLDSKNALRDELSVVEKERDRKRAEARSLRENLPYSRMEHIDEEVKKLEYRLTHTSLTLQEEKKALQQIKDLNKSREVVKEYNDKVEKSTQDEGLRSTLIENIKEKDKLLNSLKTQEQQQKKVVGEIREKQAASAINVPALIEERNAAYDRIKVLREEVKELRGEFRAKEDEFWEREREWREQQAVERKIAFEKREAERVEREQYRKQKELENFVEPYTDEIILCDQLFHYLQKYAPATEEASSSPASSKVEIQAPKGVGTMILSKKTRNDEELDSWFSGKSKGKKNNSGSSAVKNREKEKISLSLDVLTSFGKLKLSPPTTVGDVTKSVEEVKAKKEHFVKLQNDEREVRENKAKKVEVVEPQAAPAVPVEVVDTPAVAAEPEVVQEEEKAEDVVEVEKEEEEAPPS